MINRRHSGLAASLLAFSLMACTGSPLGVGDDKGGKPGGTGGTPAAPTSSPYLELELPDQQDEPVMPEVQGLSWALQESASPRDQRIQRIHGALRADGGYKFFLQQGDHFYYRTVAKNASSLPAWSETQKLPSHRGLYPTRLFSDGERLFFVDDRDETQFSPTQRIYQAKEGELEWSSPSALPDGILAVAAGRGVAFAANANKLYLHVSGSWQELVTIPAHTNQEFVALSYDESQSANDLIVLLKSTTGSTFRVMRLPAGYAGYNSLQDAQVTYALSNAESLLKVLRSFKMASLDGYHYWAITSKGRIFYGSTGSTLQAYDGLPNLNWTFNGLQKLAGRFYAYRWAEGPGPEVHYLHDTNVTERNWRKLESKKRDGSDWRVKLEGAESLATDGQRLYTAGSQGLFRYPLVNDEPAAYAQDSVGWEQESVELNRAPVEQVIRCGTETYARTAFGTYTQKNGAWVPFELEGKPATIFSSIYGQAATVTRDGGVGFYLFLNGAWTPVPSTFPNGVSPKANKLFFSHDRLFVATGVLNGEAIYQRPLNDATSGWTQAAPGQGASSNYPTYISDGRVIFAVAIDKVRLATLAEQTWKDYSTVLVKPDGSTQQMYGPTFEVPFAVRGYAFAWVNLGVKDYRLCRATSKGWKQLVTNQFEGAEVGRLLSTDGHYLYSTTTLNGNTREIVRLPIKDGSAWERLPATVTLSQTVSLSEANLKVNAPPFIDRTQAKVYLPTSLGILGP